MLKYLELCATFSRYQFISLMHISKLFIFSWLTCYIDNITWAQFLAFLLLQKSYYFPQYRPVLCHSRWSFRWRGKKSQKFPWSVFLKTYRKFCTQVVKRNVLITGECCTHTSEYFSILFLYQDFVTKLFRRFEHLLHRQIEKCSRVSMLMKLWNKIVHIIRYTWLTF